MEFPIDTFVEFVGWDSDRDGEFLENVRGYKPTGRGYIVRRDLNNTYCVQWEDSVRSMHYGEELKEYVEYSIDEAKQKRLVWLKKKGYRKVRSKKTGESFFLTREGMRKSIDEVRQEYEFHIMCEIVFKRMAILAAYDSDHAREENGVGFNKFDTTFGNSLVDNYKKRGEWTQKQLAAAIRISHKYKGQLKRVMGEGYEPITSWKKLNLELEDKYLDEQS